MRNYVADVPISIHNNAAILQAVGCIDKEENAFQYPCHEQFGGLLKKDER